MSATGQQYDNEMRGVLFKNDRRVEGDDRSPNAKGECQINGVRYWVSAWTKTKRDGGKYQQLRFERADDRHQPASAAPAPDQSAGYELPPVDDIPF